MSNTSPALIVIALGTNDAVPPRHRVATFAKAHAALLKVSDSIAARTAIVTIPSIEPGDVTRGGGFDPA